MLLKWSLVGVLLVVMVAADTEESPGVPKEEAETRGVLEELSPRHHHYHHLRVKRQLIDGWRPTTDTLKAMENLDEMLRSTIPTIDRFQCLERLMCSMASSQLNPTAPAGSPGAPLPAFDPNFQQGLILDPSTIQQSFSGLAQNPALQQGFQVLPQSPALQQSLQQGFQAFPQNQDIQQGVQGLVQHPGFQQSLPSFQNPAFHAPPQAGQGSVPSHLGGTTFQNSFPFFRENPDAGGRTASRRENSQPVVRRRRPPFRRRPQRNSFLDFFRGLGRKRRRRETATEPNRREKRGLFDDLLSSFTSNRFMGLLDQMMTRYSFYPYTHAAYMGYSGSPGRCETLYPSCPSTAEEMIDVFNNLHKHFPDGIPYKENLPWPLNMLLP